MKNIETNLLNELCAAIEKKQELQLQLIIAEREVEELRETYRAYKEKEDGNNG